jgi:hypothetical protein
VLAAKPMCRPRVTALSSLACASWKMRGCRMPMRGSTVS